MLSLNSPVKTPLHSVPATIKLVTLCLVTLLLFRIDSITTLAISLAVVGTLYAMGGSLFFQTGLARLKPLWFFVLVISVWHFVTDAIEDGVVILLRLTAIVALANLVTMTTRMSALVDVGTRALSPFRRFGLNPETIGLSVGLVIRFIPVLTDKFSKVAEAWGARSAKRQNWRMLFPVFLTTIDDAEQVADALMARGGLRSTK